MQKSQIMERINQVLGQSFNSRYVESLIGHYREAVDGFDLGNWDKALSRSSKFVEATLKALTHFTKNVVQSGNKFKVDNAIQILERTEGIYDRSIRVTIPRACRFVYDITSNRGARHDSDYFVPNRMDSNVVIPTISWILAEMIRLTDGISLDCESKVVLIERLTETKHPMFESIDDRTYVNINGLSPREVAILLLYEKHPGRIQRRELAAQVKSNNSGASRNAINTALTRIRDRVDENDDGWRLRRIGMNEAEKIVSSLNNGFD